MPGIARAAELAPGTLYLYFQSKEALYVELLNEGYDLLLGRMREGINLRSAPRTQASKLIDIFFDFAREYPEYFDIMFFVLQREGHGTLDLCLTEEQLTNLRNRQNTVRAFAAEVLRRGGTGKGKSDPEIRVDAVWSMLAGVVLYFLKSDPELFRAVSAEAKKIILSGGIP